MIKIIKAGKKHIEDCIESVKNSVLEDTYFTEEKHSYELINEGINKKKIYIATDDQKNILGFMWIDKQGMFAKFPYLRIFGVKNKYRSMGIGTKMLKYFEETGFKCEKKIFLLVSAVNKRALKFYLKNGYQNISVIKNLYKDGINEMLMMKIKEK